MKKYIKPSVEIYDVDMCDILAGSLTNSNNVGDNGDYAKEHNSQSLTPNTFSLWDDDEE